MFASLNVLKCFLEDYRPLLAVCVCVFKPADVCLDVSTCVQRPEVMHRGSSKLEVLNWMAAGFCLCEGHHTVAPVGNWSSCR